MGELKIKLSNQLEQIFRKMAMRKFGYQKGAISAAAQEAIEQWSAMHMEPEHIEDPIKEISGLMKHVKKSSVQLEHEAQDYAANNLIKKRGKHAH